MTEIYLHGIDTIEGTNGPRPVQTIDTGIIGLVGTAPSANATNYPLNTCVPIHGLNDIPEGIGSDGTLKDALDGIFDQAGKVSQTVVLVRVEEGANIGESMGNIIGDRVARTGMQALRHAAAEWGLKPKLLIAPGFTSTRPTDGVASIAVGDAGTGYTEAPTAAITGDGYGASAEAVLANDGSVDSIIVTNPGGGYTSATVTLTGGGGSGATATATLGTVANPVTAELLALSKRFRAASIVDGPNTNAEDAVTYRLDWDDPTLLIIDPFAKVFDGSTPVSEPASARVAGLTARVDYEEGFWVSPSNHVLAGVIGAGRTVEHSLRDPAAESQYLNRNSVSTIVRSPAGGYKLWGSRGATSDSLQAFWPVRRAHDAIIESIEIAHEPFIDKPFGLQVLLDIAETVNGALRRWQRKGATLGGRVWLDPALNTKETWASGRLYVSYDAEAPSPIERITFVFNRNTGYYEALADRAIREIERLSGQAN